MDSVLAGADHAPVHLPGAPKTVPASTCSLLFYLFLCMFQADGRALLHRTSGGGGRRGDRAQEAASRIGGDVIEHTIPSPLHIISRSLAPSLSYANSFGILSVMYVQPLSSSTASFLPSLVLTATTYTSPIHDNLNLSSFNLYPLLSFLLLASLGFSLSLPCVPPSVIPSSNIDSFYDLIRF